MQYAIGDESQWTMSDSDGLQGMDLGSTFNGQECPQLPENLNWKIGEKNLLRVDISPRECHALLAYCNADVGGNMVLLVGMLLPHQGTDWPETHGTNTTVPHQTSSL